MNWIEDAVSTATQGKDQGKLGLWSATAVNIANMVGIGPFITIPAFVAAMQGPQALVGWIAAALLVLCDGLVWSELGAALPGTGGPYHFLRETFRGTRWGRLLPFLFIWQFMVSGALEMSSAYIGSIPYLNYAFPSVASWRLWNLLPGGENWLAALAALAVSALLCRRIGQLGWLSLLFCLGTVITVLTVVVVGLRHFNPQLLQVPPGAWDFTTWGGTVRFSRGLGAAMIIAVYDYFGYYNVCHLGDEVRDPGRTIPRAVMLSVICVAAAYLTMNTVILGVIPWQEVMKTDNVAAVLVERTSGRIAAQWFSILILWTVAACAFAITLGYSRIPLAAARNGDFFRIFARQDAAETYPMVSLAALGCLTAAFCFLNLSFVIEAAVLVRVLVQFMGQIVGLHLLRRSRPEHTLPFRMWFYPLPSGLAFCGWFFVLCAGSWPVLGASGLVLLTGLIAFWLWHGRRPAT